MPSNGHENESEHGQQDPNVSPPGVFQIGPKLPKDQIVGVGAARESEDVLEASGTVTMASSGRGSLEVVVNPPPVISSYHDLKRTTFLVDFYHSGDPEEQYQVRYLQSNRRAAYEEWEELDHDIEALVLEVARRIAEKMERDLD